MPNRFLLLVFVLAAALRVGWALRQDESRETIDRLPDQREYLTLGENLLHDHSLWMIDNRYDTRRIYAYRAPGYPAFVALCGANIKAIRIAQSLIDASVIFAVYCIGKRLFGVGSASIAAVLIALNPFLIYFSSLVLSETLYVALLAWGMALLLSKRLGMVLIGSILLAASSLTRPGAIALPILLALAAVGVRSEKRLVPLVFTIVTMAIFIGAWGVRNNKVLGQYVFTTTNAGITLYDGIHPDATGASDQTFIGEVFPVVQPMDEVRRDTYFRDRAIDQMFLDPARTIELAIVKLGRLWSPLPLSREYSQSRNRLAGAAYAIPVFLLALIAIIRPNCSWKGMVFLLLPLIYFSIAHALSVGSLRYRMPIEPMLAVLAGAALGRMFWRK